MNVSSSLHSNSSSCRPIHILFVGAGAVGCFYASRCHHVRRFRCRMHTPSFCTDLQKIQPSANIHVSLICRSNYAPIASSGVTLETRDFGVYHFTPHAVYSSIANAAASDDSPPEGWDFVVVTTKALPDITDDSKDIEPLIRR